MAITREERFKAFIREEFTLIYKMYIKRPFDFFLASGLLLILSPLLLIIYLLLRKQNKRTAFFCQERPGKGGKPFKIIKFKTMTDDRDSAGQLLPDKQRITAVGGWIRQMSLDELPQLWNVVKGDMSLIGPRPLLFKYIPLYTKEQERRHEVRPGITGWAQVNGRNTISWKKKFEFDIYYVDHLDFLLDAKIIWLTLLKVLKREGVNQSADRPMLPFDGTN